MLHFYSRKPKWNFLKDYIENVNLEERLLFAKLCNLIKNLNDEKLIKDPNASLFYLSIDNFVNNTSLRFLNVIYNRFEICLIKIGDCYRWFKKKINKLLSMGNYISNLLMIK